VRRVAMVDVLEEKRYLRVMRKMPDVGLHWRSRKMPSYVLWYEHFSQPTKKQTIEGYWGQSTATFR
jgi:hypothetical protein